MDKQDIYDMADDYSTTFIGTHTRAQMDGILHRDLTLMLIAFADNLLDKINPAHAHAGRGGFANVFEDNPDAGQE